MLRWTLYGLLAFSGIVAVVLVIGWSLPVGHSASRTRTLPAPPERVFRIVSDFARYPEWQAGVSRVEVTGDAGVGQLVRQFGRTGEIPFRVETFEPPTRLVMRIVSDGMAFGGTWTYDLSPAEGGGTEITITEDGEVYNVFFRFMSRFVFGHYATIDQYLGNLEKAALSPSPSDG